MREFMTGEAHTTAMQSISSVSKYAKVHGYFTDDLPTADEAIEEWRHDGRRVFGPYIAKYGDPAPKECWECPQ